jgi:hypothetical protein
MWYSLQPGRAPAACRWRSGRPSRTIRQAFPKGDGTRATRSRASAPWIIKWIAIMEALPVRKVGPVSRDHLWRSLCRP